MVELALQPAGSGLSPDVTVSAFDVLGTPIAGLPSLGGEGDGHRGRRGGRADDDRERGLAGGTGDGVVGRGAIGDADRAASSV